MNSATFQSAGHGAASRKVGRRLAVVLAIVAGLAGCDTSSSFRDTSARISATTRFDPVEMQGRWVVRERAAEAQDPQATAPESFEFGAVDGSQIAVIWSHRVCDAANCVDLRTPLTAKVTGPGRFVMPRGEGPPVEHWVLWTDADYRVAAIGTPSGSFGWIMTKGEARADLMQAAREIMDWNGYDIAHLQAVQK
ncbi:lipocalin family protein [Sedimentitalea sp.]|uniref:lipocalin family protein n=1 Tax=Sedimentitalea sp. TaxID=2048915 RepID=UPI00329797B7